MPDNTIRVFHAMDMTAGEKAFFRPRDNLEGPIAVTDWVDAPLEGPKTPLPPPISVRLSEPLLKAIDALAAQQDRRRTNLIQHILWEYVRANPIERKP